MIDRCITAEELIGEIMTQKAHWKNSVDKWKRQCLCFSPTFPERTSGAVRLHHSLDSSLCFGKYVYFRRLDASEDLRIDLIRGFRSSETGAPCNWEPCHVGAWNQTLPLARAGSLPGCWAPALKAGFPGDVKSPWMQPVLGQWLRWRAE